MFKSIICHGIHYPPSSQGFGTDYVVVILCLFVNLQKRLKMPKSLSEDVNLRRKDNTIVQMKRRIGHTLIYKTIHSKLKDEQEESH